MRREGAEIWLRPEEWIPWVMARHPEWIRVACAEPPRELDPVAEGKTWRGGRAQGVLARTSPLAAERARNRREGS
jgi:hypothetical protein